MRRKKRRLKKSITKFVRLIFTVLIIYGLYSFYNNVIRKEPSSNKNEPTPVEEKYLNKITNGDKLTQEQLKVITDFFDTYYKSIKELKEYDMTKYFTSDTEDALINQTAMQLLIESRKMKRNDLTMTSAKYDINIKKVEGTNTVDILVLEDGYFHFTFMSDIESKSYNVENNFTLVKENGEWKISKYDKVQDFYVMITEKYTSGGKNSLNRIKDDYLSTIKSKTVSDSIDYQNYLKHTTFPPKSYDHAYDREKALAYAIKYARARNYDWYVDTDNNCQNFASQVVYSGGIPMDYYGSDHENMQWKYYDTSYNAKETAAGFVDTWTYVEYFYAYAKNNTGYGLVADVDVSVYYAEPGDIIHVGVYGPTRHAVVVVDAYKKDGKVVDAIVNSNTNDLENYPVSAYAYPYASLIKIYGWNE